MVGGGDVPHARAGSAHPRTPEDSATLPPGALDLVGPRAVRATIDAEWQLATDAGFTQVVASGGWRSTRLPLWSLPGSATTGAGRHRRCRTNPLPWSEAYSFTTRADALVYQPQVAADFLTVANAAGPLDPPEYAAFTTDINGFPHPTTAAAPDGTRQQATGRLRCDQGWRCSPSASGRRSTSGSAASRRTVRWCPHRRARLRVALYRRVARLEKVRGQHARHRPVRAVGHRQNARHPSDDVRLIPVLCENPCTGVGTDGAFDLAGDTPLDDGADDPLTDAVYWFRPVDASPGEAGYQAYAREATAAVPYFATVGDEVWRRFSLVGLNFGEAAPYPQALPETGTVFRIVTGDVRVDAPVLTGPSDGSTVAENDLLTWIVPEGIPGVQLQIADVPDFSRTLVDFNLGSARRTDIPTIEPGVYYLRVRSRGLVNSAWSGVRSYEIATPTAIAPEEMLPTAQDIEVVAFPNPFDARVTFRFGLDAVRPVQFMLFDVIGRQVAVLHDAPLSAGWQRCRLRARIWLLASTYRLNTDAAVRTGSVVLMR